MTATSANSDRHKLANGGARFVRRICCLALGVLLTGCGARADPILRQGEWELSATSQYGLSPPRPYMEPRTVCLLFKPGTDQTREAIREILGEGDYCKKDRVLTDQGRISGTMWCPTTGGLSAHD